MIVKNVTYLDSLGVEHIPKETKKINGNKKITVNICRTLSYDSILCGYFCIGFISFMLKKKKKNFRKALSLSIDYSKCGHEYDKVFKEEELNEIAKMV